MAVLEAFDFPMPEQVDTEFRFVPMEHQTAEQLVEVPTVVSFSSLQQTAEQSIDVPGSGRRQRSSRFAPRTQFYSVGGRASR